MIRPREELFDFAETRIVKLSVSDPLYNFATNLISSAPERAKLILAGVLRPVGFHVRPLPPAPIVTSPLYQACERIEAKEKALKWKEKGDAYPQ